MIIRKSNEELDRMRQAGRIVAETISSVVEAVRPGVTTADLDRLAESIIRERGATPSFLNYKGTYPATICASIDDEIVHGIPSDKRVLEEGLPGWVERSVEQILVAFSRRADESVMVEARAAGQRARDDIVPRVRTLLEADVDAQWTNPLAIVRAAVRYPTEVLRAAGVPPVVRDEQAERQFPDDDYDLTPTRLADIDPELHEPSLAWGAAKAFVMKARHRELGG